MATSMRVSGLITSIMVMVLTRIRKMGPSLVASGSMALEAARAGKSGKMAAATPANMKTAKNMAWAISSGATIQSFKEISKITISKDRALSRGQMAENI